MIPRTKVNYRLRDILRAAGKSNKEYSLREGLIGLLGELFATPYIIPTASGRGALYILLSCLPQRRLLIPAYTCKAVVEAAILAGKELVFVEVESDGFNMTPESIKNNLDPDTILLATHQFGIPCNILEMVRIAREAGAYIIEDVAAALGSRVGGQLVGTFGDAAFFSFDSTKLINAPLKAGFLLVRDYSIFNLCKRFTNENTVEMPLSRKLLYLMLGAFLVMLEQPLVYRIFHIFKFQLRGRFTDDSDDLIPLLGPFYCDRLAEWQAAILIPQIQDLEKIVAIRRRFYSEYQYKLRGLENIALPPIDIHGEWAPIRFPIRIKGDKMKFYSKSIKKGVDYAFSFTFLACPKYFVASHQLATSILDLPFYNRLTLPELNRVVNVIRALDKTI